jgi:hypothetical protein
MPTECAIDDLCCRDFVAFRKYSEYWVQRGWQPCQSELITRIEPPVQKPAPPILMSGLALTAVLIVSLLWRR